MLKKKPINKKGKLKWWVRHPECRDDLLEAGWDSGLALLC